MDKTLEERVKEVRRTYFKNWRENNRDKVKEHNASYWERRALRLEQEAANNDTVSDANANE